MKIYNAVGYSLIALHVVLSALFAPKEWGSLLGAGFGFAYLVFVWFFGSPVHDDGAARRLRGCELDNR